MTTPLLTVFEENFLDIEGVDHGSFAYMSDFIHECEKKGFSVSKYGAFNSGMHVHDDFKVRATAPHGIVEADMELHKFSEHQLRFSIMAERAWRDGFLGQIIETVVKKYVQCIWCAKGDQVHEHAMAAIFRIAPLSESVSSIIDYIALLDLKAHELSIRTLKLRQKYGEILSKRLIRSEHKKSRMRGNIMNLQRGIRDEEKLNLDFNYEVRERFQQALAHITENTRG